MGDAEAGTRQCFDCGFLALRNMEGAALLEADGIYRQVGATGHYNVRLANYPVCFALAASLSDEGIAEIRAIHQDYVRDMGAEDANTTDMWDEAFRDASALVVRRDRTCPSWTKWQQGFSPKEHRELLDRQWMRKQEEQRLDADRRWQRRMRRDERNWRASVRSEERWWRVGELLVLGVFVSGATLLAGAVGGGWAPGWWPF